MVEGYLLNKRSFEEILPTTTEEEMEPATGGMVFYPSSGIKDWVCVFDLKSLYPSAMLTGNISEETLTDDPERVDIIIPDIPLNDKHASGSKITEEDLTWSLPEAIGVDLSTEGIVPKYLGDLFEDRSYYKRKRNQFSPDQPEYDTYDNQQRSVKVLMNSHFGCANNQYFRLSTDAFGDAITALSRYVAWKGMEVARRLGHEVIYSDTDSAFIQLGSGGEDLSAEEVVAMGEDLEESINQEMDKVADAIGVPGEHPYLKDRKLHGTDRQCFLWESEKLYRRFLQSGSKKRYAGNIIWKEGSYVDDTDIVGYEAVRSSSPEITSDFQEGVIQHILSGSGFEEISEYTDQFVNGVVEDERPIQEMAIPGVLNKDPHDYPNRPVPRACMYSNEYLGYDWGDGDNPFVVFIKDSPPDVPNTEEIAVEWSEDGVPDGFEIDYQKHIEKHMKDPMEPILDLVNYSFGELRTGKRSSSAFESTDDGSDPFSSDGSSGPSDPFSD